MFWQRKVSSTRSPHALSGKLEPGIPQHAWVPPVEFWDETGGALGGPLERNTQPSIKPRNQSSNQVFKTGQRSPFKPNVRGSLGKHNCQLSLRMNCHTQRWKSSRILRRHKPASSSSLPALNEKLSSPVGEPPN